MLKKGDTVIMNDCGEAEHYEGIIWTCESDEWELPHHRKVVKLKGFSGGFSVDCLLKVNPTDDEILICESCGKAIMSNSKGYVTLYEGADTYCLACEKENSKIAIAEMNVFNSLNELKTKQPLYLVVNTKRNVLMTQEIIEVMKKYDCWGDNY